MRRHEFLTKLHEVYQPRTYFEIGVNDGRSLALSRVPTVAVDPAFKVVKEINCDLRLVRETSDAFFERERPFGHLGDAAVDLAFIDGMHLFEFALRDFLNVEKAMSWAGVAVFDDMLPRNVDEAARDRHTNAWTGDVYKVVPVLQRYRPDLVTILVDTEPTGMLVVLGLDPASAALPDSYDEIIAAYVLNDPQQVPSEVLERRVALDPQRVLDAAFWSTLTAARDGSKEDYGVDDLRADVAKELDLSTVPNLAEWRPDPALAAPAKIEKEPVAQAASATPAGRPRTFAGRLASNRRIRHLGGRVVRQLPQGLQRAIRSRVR